MKSKKVFNIIEIVVGVLFIAGFVCCIAMQYSNPEAPFAIWLKNNVWDISKTLDGLKSQIPEIIQCII